MRIPVLLVIPWLLATQLAFAQDSIRITPQLAIEEDVERAFSSEKQRSSGIVEGAGDTLQIRYTSSIPVPALVTPFNSDSTYNPGDTLQFELPAGSQQTAEIDVTIHSAWKPWRNKYHVLFLSSSTDQSAVTIHDVQVIDTGRATLPTIVRHILEPENYKVSTVHLLLGYRVLGFSLTLIFGLLAILIIAVLLARKTSMGTILLVLAGFSLLYSARVTADQIRWSAEHQKEWRKTGTYSVADDMHSVAKVLREQAQISAMAHRVSVCHDSTNYYTKLLRYLLAPIPVVTEQGTGPLPTHIVVAKKIDWSYEDGFLRCGGRTVRAEKLDTFEKGAILFRVPPAS